MEFRLPRLLSDGMILQRNQPLKIWGWAAAGMEINVRFLDEEYSALTSQTGLWYIILPELEAGGPYSMEFSAADEVIIINDILVGDVWLCSGQSNMVLPMARVEPLYVEDIAQSTNPEIRQFKVPDCFDFSTPHTDLESGNWMSADPKSVLEFSAVGYFFARKLHEKYGIPIGIITAAVGGSPVEAWMSEDSLRKFPHHLEEAHKYSLPEQIEAIQVQDAKAQQKWFHKLAKKDRGLIEPLPWWDPRYSGYENWPTIELPQDFSAEKELAGIVGSVWLRTSFSLPQELAQKPAKLLLGTIVDSDTAYLNGKEVGNTGYQYPPRRYSVPTGLLREGENVLVVRVVSNAGQGGFVKEKPYKLVVGEKEIDLCGNWHYQVGTTTMPPPPTTFFTSKPLGLFNGMISPLIDYGIKGITWYQGESNTGDPEEYLDLFSTLVEDWRDKWQKSDLPFLYVQLANFMEPDKEPSESNWAELREQQRQALKIPNTAMAVAIDVGEWNDLHPLNKKAVGERLSLGAMHLSYGEHEVSYSGPICQSAERQGNKVTLHFTHTAGGLITKDGEQVNHLAIAGSDGEFVFAHGEIDGDRAIVWHEDIKEPVIVRYAWANNPAKANLYNRAGLPASPFHIRLV